MSNWPSESGVLRVLRVGIVWGCVALGLIWHGAEAPAQTVLTNPNEGKNVVGGTGPLAPAPVVTATPTPTTPETPAPDPKDEPPTAPVTAEEAPASDAPATTEAPASDATATLPEPVVIEEAPAATTAPDPAVAAISATGDLDIAGALTALAGSFEDGEAEAFAAMLLDMPEGISGDSFGHLLYTRRHFDRAAWFFGASAQSPSAQPASLSNFGALLGEVHADAPDTWPESFLTTAFDALTAANTAQPDDPAILNNLGVAARRLGRLEDALAAATRATELAPDEPLYWTNLARIHDAAGDAEAAAAALARAHLLEPNGLALLETLPALPGAAPAYGQAIQNQCNVNFRCQEICPRSIIGGLMSVTCEIENSSAQIACMEGRPYPTTYDCNEDLPEYGILIPGLNSGFSIAVPGFSLHVLVQGDGSVDVRAEAGVSIGPVTPYIRGDGHFSPSGGASFDNLGGGVRVNVLPNSPANQLASDLGHPPVHIELEQVGDGPRQINVETYNYGLISF